MSLSCFGKKGTKEAAIGAPLSIALPRAKAMVPLCTPPGAHLGYFGAP